MTSLSLGVIYEDGKMKHHRSLFKLIINPFLRWLFGKEFGSCFDIETGKFVRYVFIDTKLVGDTVELSLIDELKATWNYPLNDNMRVAKYRRFW